MVADMQNLDRLVMPGEIERESVLFSDALEAARRDYRQAVIFDRPSQLRDHAGRFA